MAGTRERVTGFPQALGREAELGVSSTTQQFPLGALCMDQKGNIYRYVINNLSDNVAIADGTCVYGTTTWGSVSPDFTGGNGITTNVVGVGIVAIAAGSYGWIQVSGYHDAVKTDGAVAAADFLVGHSVNGEADTMADGEEEQVFGQALAADTGTEPHSCPAHIKCL
jgi:hypothetical protein